MTGSHLHVTDWRDYTNEALSPLQQRTLDAMVKYGYYGATVKLIAESASMTVPGLYYHYPSKQAMLADLLHSSIDELLLRSELAREAAGESTITQFSYQVENAVLFMTYRYKQRLLAARDVWALEPDSQADYLRKRASYESRIWETLEQGVREGLFKVDPEPSIARAVLDMCAGVALWYTPGVSEEPEQIAERYGRYCLQLVGHPG